MRRLLVLVVVLAVFLALVGLPAATAMKNPGPKNSEWIDSEIHDVYGPFPIFSCTDGRPGPPDAPDSDFIVELSGEFHDVHAHQPIGNGDVVKHQTWTWGVDTFTNSEDDSKFASGKFNTSDVGHLSGDEEEEEGTIRVHGAFWHVMAPGYGPVILQVGILTIKLAPPAEPEFSFKGNDDLRPGPGTDPMLCAALS